MQTSYLLISIILMASSIKAMQCFAGEFYSTEVTECSQCHISCHTCHSEKGCSTCYDQMYLSPKGNQVICDLCYNVLKNCQSCISSHKCEKCSNGYYADDNNVCRTCDTFEPGCLFCRTDQTSFKCVSCNLTTHSLVNWQCISKSAPNNSNPQIGTPTQTQSPPTQISQGNSQGNQQNQQTPVAQFEGSIVPVSECNNGKIRVGNTCILPIPFCLSYDQNNLVCKECGLTFHINSIGFCIPQFLLLNGGDQSGGIVNTPVNPGPDRPNINTPNRQEVPGPNRPNRPQIIPQTPQDCIQEQYFWYGRCVTIGTECSSRDLDGKCDECILGYELDSQKGLCIQLPPKSIQTNEPSQQPPNPAVSNETTPPKPICNAQLFCKTCKADDVDFCQTCLQGYTTVDSPMFAGRCFAL